MKTPEVANIWLNTKDQSSSFFFFFWQQKTEIFILVSPRKFKKLIYVFKL